MEEIIVKFEIKRFFNGEWRDFFGEIKLKPESHAPFDAEVIRCAAISALEEQCGRYPEDELILTFEKP